MGQDTKKKLFSFFKKDKKLKLIKKRKSLDNKKKKNYLDIRYNKEVANGFDVFGWVDRWIENGWKKKGTKNFTSFLFPNFSSTTWRQHSGTAGIRGKEKQKTKQNWFDLNVEKKKKNWFLFSCQDFASCCSRYVSYSRSQTHGPLAQQFRAYKLSTRWVARSRSTFFCLFVFFFLLFVGIPSDVSKCSSIQRKTQTKLKNSFPMLNCSLSLSVPCPQVINWMTL